MFPFDRFITENLSSFSNSDSRNLWPSPSKSKQQVSVLSNRHPRKKWQNSPLEMESSDVKWDDPISKNSNDVRTLDAGWLKSADLTRSLPL